MADERKPLRASPAALALPIVAVVALVVAVSAARSGAEAVLRSDAQHFYKVALDPFGDGSAFADEGDVIAAYRYSRILYPLVTFVAAAGRPGLMLWSQAVVFLAGVLLMLSIASALARRSGAPTIRGLAVAVVPAFWFPLPYLVSDPLAVGMVLAMFWFARTGRDAKAKVAGALALLTRELMLLAVLPLAWRAYRRDGLRAGAAWMLTGVPIAAWWVWIRFRIGRWPLDYPVGGDSPALTVPFTGYVDTISRYGLSGWLALTLVIAAATIAACVVLVARGTRGPLAGAAILFTVVVLGLGPAALTLPGEAIRLMLPAQVLLFVALSTGAPSSAKTSPALPTS